VLELRLECAQNIRYRSCVAIVPADPAAVAAVVCFSQSLGWTTSSRKGAMSPGGAPAGVTAESRTPKNRIPGSVSVEPLQCGAVFLPELLGHPHDRRWAGAFGVGEDLAQVTVISRPELILDDDRRTGE
jgi:hypothetical protein